jgi:hypothetical protein
MKARFGLWTLECNRAVIGAYSAHRNLFRIVMSSTIEAVGHQPWHMKVLCGSAKPSQHAIASPFACNIRASQTGQCAKLRQSWTRHVARNKLTRVSLSGCPQDAHLKAAFTLSQAQQAKMILGCLDGQRWMRTILRCHQTRIVKAKVIIMTQNNSVLTIKAYLITDSKISAEDQGRKRIN